MLKYSYLILLCLITSACTVNSGQFDPFVYGKIEKKLTVGNAERQYVIHVPTGYIGSKSLPLVVVFHDEGDQGNSFYEASGWKEVCNRENVFVIFPTAKEYCQSNNQPAFSQWNFSPVDETKVCAGVAMENDVQFIDKILEKTFIEYNIDKKNLYMVGFGEGGKMVAKMLVDSPQPWTASTQFAGSFANTFEWQPGRKVPVLFQVGNQDATFFKESIPVPLSRLSDLNNSQNPFFPIASTFTNAYKISSPFLLAGDTTKIAKAVFSMPEGNQVLEISLLGDIKHEYPNRAGVFQAASDHWNWMKKYGGL